MKLCKLIKKRILVGSILTLSIFCVGCSNNSSESTLDKDTLIVGIDDAFAPLGFKDESGEITGFDIDLAKELAKRLNKKIIFQPIDWTMKESELRSGNIDLIWNGYTITDERKNKVDFSVPYLKNKVGAQSESSAVAAMEKEEDLYSSFNGGGAITFEDNNQALMDLEAGRLDAVVADEILVRYYLSLKGEDKFKILGDNFGEEEYGVGIRKGDMGMVDAFNKAYKEMQEDGTLKEISEKWFNKDITIKIE